MTTTTITRTPRTTPTPTAHDCLLACGETTTHESGVCDSCADHPDAEDQLLADLSAFRFFHPEIFGRWAS